jgi:hypothetical protein
MVASLMMLMKRGSSILWLKEVVASKLWKEERGDGLMLFFDRSCGHHTAVDRSPECIPPELKLPISRT